MDIKAYHIEAVPGAPESVQVMMDVGSARTLTLYLRTLLHMLPSHMYMSEQDRKILSKLELEIRNITSDL